ncbi:uncharacterized protein LOC129885611 isoform X1 [Solanum dulcamara]|uniref:uncharacterized protein LOC129885611 isoform X1 n=2 Tax=Solanum dulcamara TaxID=45834 RepID=UPI002484E284|nr:uncharacterized protein LOC129885611 isoform X1 [Solanum dulcamara]
MAWRGSVTRSLISTARASTSRSSPTINRVRTPPISAPRSNTRRFSFTSTRTLGALGCTQSLLPLHNMVAGTRLTSHLSVNVRACCELYHGTFQRSCQDR